MPEPALIVNGVPIPEAEIRAELAAIRKDLETRGIELPLEQRMALRERAVARLIERVLVAQECRRLGLAPDAREIEEAATALVPRADGVAGCRAGTDLPEVTREAAWRLTLKCIITHWCRHLNPPKSTEVRDYYRAHLEQFRRPETVHAAHLVRNKEGRDAGDIRAEMEAVRQRLLAGEELAALAATCSDCPENGGDLGFFSRDAMVEEFNEVVFAAPPGEVTPVFETRFGLHIALVYERRPAGVMDLNEVGGHIAEALYRGKQDQEVGRQLEALRRKVVLG